VYSNIIVSLYIYEEQCLKTFKKLFIYSFSNIDVSTGSCNIYSSNNYIYDKNAMYDDIFRYIEANNCKELIITTNNVTEFNKDDLLRSINIQNRIIHMNFNSIEKEYLTISYQNNFLNKVYKINSFLTPIEYLNLEKNQETIVSFIILLNYCKLVTCIINYGKRSLFYLIFIISFLKNFSINFTN
jgi:DNA mismatch repair protein MutS